MATSDDLFKREEDRRWRESVDKTIVNLTTSLKVIQDTLGEIRNEISELDEVLRGSALEKTDGVVQQIRELYSQGNKLNRVVIGDFEGKGGLKGMVAGLLDSRTYQRERRSDWLRFWTPIIVAIVSTIGLILTNWPHIKAVVHPEHPVIITTPDKPKTKARRVRRPVVEEEPAEESS